jgi:hypothetical protein
LWSYVGTPRDEAELVLYGRDNLPGSLGSQQWLWCLSKYKHLAT